MSNSLHSSTRRTGSMPSRSRGASGAVRILVALGCALLATAAVPANESIESTPDALVIPEVIRGTFTGDLPEIRKRGILRALVSPSRTDFFLQGARPRGILVELLEHYRKALNKGRKRGELPIAVKYVVVPFKELIPALREGRGDLVAAHLTVTPEREKKVAFVRGKQNNVDELLVTHKNVEGIASIDDLAGRSVTVLAGSSYAEHLRALNKTFAKEGRKPIVIEEADSLLVTEDLLEMVNAGVLDITVADDYRAMLWAKVLPDLVVHESVKVHAGGTLGWAVRKDNPELLEGLEAAAPGVRAGSLIGNTLLRRYFASTRWITNPTSRAERGRLKKFEKLFRRYGDRYGFDWMALAAQGYQESTLDQSVKSKAGAIGVMQVLPSTARSKAVGIKDISTVENNIHAGTKYLAYLRERYFDDPSLQEEDRLAFSWAAYNAGPAKVTRMRRKARELSLDPDRWFGNVEHAALALVGQETVRYVRNVYKYYITYRSLLESSRARRKLIEGASS